MLLSHQSGLPRTTAKFPREKFWDWETRSGALARSAPLWAPGTRCEYHAGTFGYLVGNVVRRIDGRPLATYFREEIAEPLGADALIACGPEEEHRCAEVVGPEDDIEGTDIRQFRAAGDGAASGHSTAAGSARMYAALACGGHLDRVRLLRAETIEAAVQEQPLVHADGVAEGFGLGYQLREHMSPELLGTRTFGHGGLGGAIGFADPTKNGSVSVT